MNNQVDHDALSVLLNDLVMIRIVTTVNLVSLSILELLEYGFTRKDIDRAMVKGVIEFDKPPVLPETASKSDVVYHILETGDYHFGLLGNKVRLTKLGLYILEIVESDEKQAMRAAGDLPEPAEEAASSFAGPAPLL